MQDAVTEGRHICKSLPGQEKDSHILVNPLVKKPCQFHPERASENQVYIQKII